MKKFSQAIIVILGIGILSACGTSESKSKTSEEKAQKEVKEETKPEEPAKKEVVEITIQAIGESMNEIEFVPKSINIPANSRVKLSLENKSSAAGMLHNFVLVELGSGQEIATAGIKAGKENEFVPKDSRVFAYTAVADLGETVSIEFDAPAAGSYHYICTYPGHYPKMIGRLNVQ